MKLTFFFSLFAETDKMNQYAGVFTVLLSLDPDLLLFPELTLFFISTVDVTLDPETASAWLLLSPDGKKVEFFDCECKTDPLWTILRNRLMTVLFPRIRR